MQRSKQSTRKGKWFALVHAHHVFDGHVVTGRVRGAAGVAPEHLARKCLDGWPGKVEQGGVQRGPIRLRTIPCKPEAGLSQMLEWHCCKSRPDGMLQPGGACSPAACKMLLRARRWCQVCLGKTLRTGAASASEAR